MKEIDELKDNITGWIQEMQSRTKDLPELEATVLENLDNILYNYEKIITLEGDFEEMKSELFTMKMILTEVLKEQNAKKNRMDLRKRRL